MPSPGRPRPWRSWDAWRGSDPKRSTSQRVGDPGGTIHPTTKFIQLRIGRGWQSLRGWMLGILASGGFDRERLEEKKRKGQGSWPNALAKARTLERFSAHFVDRHNVTNVAVSC